MLLAYCKSYEGHSKIGNDFPASYWNQDSKIFTIFEVSFLHNKFRRHLIFRMSMYISHILAPRASGDYTLGPILRLV